MTQDELAEQGIRRFRRRIWADPTDYIRMEIVDGKPGIWLHLWARRTQQICHYKTPQQLLNLEQDTTHDYEPYTGPLDPEDTKP